MNPKRPGQNRAKELHGSVTVLLFLCVSSGALGQRELGLPEIVTRFRHSDESLRDYRLQYNCVSKWMYHTHADDSGRIVRLEPKNEEDRERSWVEEFSLAVKGDKFLSEKHRTDTINGMVYSRKQAFDGRLYKDFIDRTTIMEGVVSEPDREFRYIDEESSYDAYFKNLRSVPITEWFAKHSPRLRSEKENVLGSACYVVECKQGEGGTRGVFWMSPEYGFRPVKMDYIWPNGEKISYEITEMTEVTDGVWLPVSGRREVHKIDPLSQSLVLYSVTNLEADPKTMKVNEGLDDRLFDFEFPEGTKVYDRISNRRYTAGGAPAGEQPKRPPIYQTDGRGMERIQAAVDQARETGKNIVLMIGGNWCGWCYKLHATLENAPGVHELLEKNYILIMIDSEADKDVLKKWAVQPNGYPYLVILDASGGKLTEQETGALVVEGKHDPEKLRSFLQKWRRP